MDNWRLWVILGVSFFFAYSNHSRSVIQGFASWAYFWLAGIVWGVFILHSYQSFLLMQGADLGPRGVELQSQNLHLLWLSVLLDIVLMALPPFWYWHDKRKMRAQIT